jgi:uncharacterized protein (DUF2141 family)
MASTSAIGIAFAAPIVALAALPAVSGKAKADQAPSEHSATLDITVRGIKSARGVIRLAICPPNAGFPECKGREVRSASLPIANGQARVHFADLSAGVYGISVFHDANANGKLDTFLGIPKEGYGFSRNPSFRPRAPRFSEVELAISGVTAETITLHYIL